MREIKFRAWDTRFNDMHYYPEIHQWNLNMPDLEEITLMQYTGIKDKNGKEIYEGDIVKCDGYYEDIYVCKYGRASFVLGVQQGNFGLSIVMQDSYQMEIIGNIYENPELLKS
jgi:uncharacterized phage protein (TIGR01671 family)